MRFDRVTYLRFIPRRGWCDRIVRRIVRGAQNDVRNKAAPRTLIGPDFSTFPGFVVRCDSDNFAGLLTARPSVIAGGRSGFVGRPLRTEESRRAAPGRRTRPTR